MKIGLHTFTPYERLFFSRIYPNNHYKLTPPPVMTVVTLYQHQHDKHHLHQSFIIASEKWGGSEFIPTDNSNLNQLYENWFVYFYFRRATLFSQGYILIIITNMILNIINIIIAVSQLQRSEEGLRRMGSSWTGIELYYTPGWKNHHRHRHHHHRSSKDCPTSEICITTVSTLSSPSFTKQWCVQTPFQLGRVVEVNNLDSLVNKTSWIL